MAEQKRILKEHIKNVAEEDYSALYKLPSAEQIRDLQIRNKKGEGDVLIPK